MGHTLAKLSTFKSYALKQASVSHGPPEIGIEPTNQCNLKCIMCARTHEMTRPIGDMTFENFKKLIDESKHHLEFVELQDLGEPLFNKELFKMIAYCKEKGIKTGMSTNSTILTESSARNLMEAGLNQITFAFDGATKQTYEKVRVGGNYDLVIANIKRFLQIKKEMKSKIYCIMQCIAMNETEDEIRTFKAMWNNVPGVNAVRIRQVTYTGTGKFDNKKDSPCYWLWRDPHVKWDGTFVPCCQDTNNSLALGNIKEKTIEEMWNSPKMQEIRQLHIDGRASEIPLCKNCNMYQPAMPFALADALVPAETRNKIVPTVETIASFMRFGKRKEAKPSNGEIKLNVV